MSRDEYYILDEAELALWQSAMKDVKAYQPKEAPELIAKASQKQKQASVTASTNRPPLPAATANNHHMRTLEAGRYDGVDAATVKRLKRGRIPIDVTLDLHGLTQRQAFDALERCVMQSLLQQKRVLLVITGKGREGSGVLKEALTSWLNDERLRPYLLAFDWARREDGGSGAAYVLLKKLMVRNNADDFSGR